MRGTTQNEERTTATQPLDPLVRVLATIEGLASLPPEQRRARLEAVLPAVLTELADTNRRLRELGARRDALLATTATELRSAAEVLDKGSSQPLEEQALKLRALSEDLDRALHPAADTRPARRAPRNTGARARLLIADDEEDAREALRDALEPEFEILEAGDGEKAVEVARAEHPDVVLMDLFMPKLDGLGALERLRADAATADIPVLFVSGQSDDSIKVRSLDLGAVDYLQKPFSDLELRARVDRTLRFVRSQSALRALAQTDALTGLANLRAFRARLEEEVKRAQRYRTPLTCVMADMDELKPINDELGHAAGDRAIAAVATVIRDELRETDFGARYGGDEFVLLLPHTSAEEGRVLAERICARLRLTEVSMGDRRVPVHASFGVASLSEDERTDAADALVRTADTALYTAKRGGRGRVASAAPYEPSAPPPGP